MKHFIFLLIFFCCVNNSNAQMRYKGQNSIALNGGASTKGFYTNLNYQRQVSDGGSIFRVDVDYTYTSRNINVISGNIESNITTLGVAYAYSLPNFLGNRIFIQPYLGGYGGFETYGVPEELKEFISGNTEDGFVYGLYGGIEFEINVSNSFSFTINGSHNYSFKSDINQNITKGGAGIKVYF